MNKIKTTLGALGAFAAASFAATPSDYTASEAATTLSTAMTGLTNDVTYTIGPVAIGLAVAVGMVVVGRAFIKKFFKA